MDPARILGLVSIVSRLSRALVWVLNPNKSAPREWREYPNRCPYLDARKRLTRSESD